MMYPLRNKPNRKSLAYRIYVDLVIGQKLRRAGVLRERRRHMMSRIASERGVTRARVRWVYDSFIRPQMREGTTIRDLA